MSPLFSSVAALQATFPTLPLYQTAILSVPTTPLLRMSPPTPYPMARKQCPRVFFSLTAPYFSSTAHILAAVAASWLMILSFHQSSTMPQHPLGSASQLCPQLQSHASTTPLQSCLLVVKSLSRDLTPPSATVLQEWSAPAGLHSATTAIPAPCSSSKRRRPRTRPNIAWRSSRRHTRMLRRGLSSPRVRTTWRITAASQYAQH